MCVIGGGDCVDKFCIFFDCDFFDWLSIDSGFDLMDYVFIYFGCFWGLFVFGDIVLVEYSDCIGGGVF